MSEHRYNTKCYCGQRLSLVSPVAKWGIAATCPNCNRRAFLKRVKGTFNPDHKCDDRCLNAHGNVCVCACGGANHGKNHGIAQVVAVDRDTGSHNPLRHPTPEEIEKFNAGFVSTPPPVKPVGHLGEVGGHITGEVELVNRRPLDNDRFLFQFRANDRTRISWFVPDQYAPDWQVGWKGTIRAKVKAHEDHPDYGKSTVVLFVEEA